MSPDGVAYHLSVRGKRVVRSWQEALDGWEAWMRASGAPATTIGQRLYQVRRVAVDHPETGPWQLDLSDLVTWLAGRPAWKPATRRGYRAAIRAFYAWAEAVGQIERSPAAGLPAVKPTRGLPRPCPEDVLRAALGTTDDRTRLMLLLAAYGGLRRAEIAQSRREHAWRDGAGAWWLRVHGKGDAYRDVPLTGALSAAVLACDPGPLFPGRGGEPITPAHLGVLTRRALPAGWTLHTLRHRFATRAHESGADAADIAELLGHANLENVMVYTRVCRSRLRRAVEGAA